MKITFETCQFDPDRLRCKVDLDAEQHARVRERLNALPLDRYYEELGEFEGLGGEIEIDGQRATALFGCLDDCDLSIELPKRGASQDDDLDMWALMGDRCAHMWIDFVPFAKALLT